MDETDRHKHTDTHPAELTTTEARQGSRRPMTMRVLVLGTLLAALALVAVWAYFYLGASAPPTIEGAPPRS